MLFSKKKKELWEDIAEYRKEEDWEKAKEILETNEIVFKTNIISTNKYMYHGCGCGTAIRTKNMPEVSRTYYISVKEQDINRAKVLLWKEK